MTDKEKLFAGIKLIQEACHNEEIVEEFYDHDLTELKKQYSSLPASRVSLMIAEGWERESRVIEFDEAGNFLNIF